MKNPRGQSETRATIRGNKLGRSFSNKKGTQLVVTPFYDREMRTVRHTKTFKRLQRLNGKTIVHYDYK